MGYYKRLNQAFLNVPILPLNENSKYILISDCHRGTGTSNDNFLKNQHLYFAALQHYYAKGYTYIELGDGDELWENRKMEQIIEIHSNVFWLLSLFFEENRLYLLYGNHDIVKKKPKYSAKTCSSYFCTTSQNSKPLFPKMPFYSGLILEDTKVKQKIFLTHGHQADILNSTLWWLARFMVRYLWGPLERFGLLDPTSAAKNNTKKHKTEQRLSHWAKHENRILITGHTHRPMVGTKDISYFNTGSCVHPRCITCIEIENRCITLVKWTMTTRADMTLYVAREVLSQPICIDKLY